MTRKTTLSTFALIVCAVLVSACSQAPSTDAKLSSAERSAVQTEVEAYLDEYMDAFLSADADRIRNLYLPGERFHWYEDGKLRYRDPEAIVTVHESLREGYLTTVLIETKIDPLSTTVANVSALWDSQLRLSSGDELAFEGCLTMLLEKAGSGEWRAVSGHSSQGK